MEDNILAHSNLIVTAEETKTLEDYLAEILRLRSEIDAEQEEIERIKLDNRVDEIRASRSSEANTLHAGAPCSLQPLRAL